MTKRLETGFIEDAAVTGSKIAPGAIDSSKIDSIDEGKINFDGTGHDHSGGASGAIVDWSSIGSKPASFPPSGHASSHQDGQTDEINVGGLSGVLADAQVPQAHAIGTAGGYHTGALPESDVTFSGTGHAHTGAAGGAQIDHASLLNVTTDQHHAEVHALDPVSGKHTGSLPEGSVTFGAAGHAHSGGADGAAVAHSDLNDDEPGKHRLINDAGTGATELWSAQKINAEFVAVSSGYSRRAACINLVDPTAAPPTESTGDRYILDFDAGTVHADWDGASKGDIVEFNGTTWDATSPLEGWVTYLDTQNKDALYVDDGTPEWELRPTYGQLHADLTDVTSDQHHAEVHAIDPASGKHTGSLPEASVTFDDSTGHDHSGAGANGSKVAHSDTTGQTTDDHHAEVHALDPAGGKHTGTLPEASVAFGGTGHAHSGGADGAQVDYGDLLNVPSAFAPSVHALGGSDHSASTLAQINALVSDATLAGLGNANTWTRTQTFTPSVGEIAAAFNGAANAAGAGYGGATAQGGASTGGGGAGGTGFYGVGGAGNGAGYAGIGVRGLSAAGGPLGFGGPGVLGENTGAVTPAFFLSVGIGAVGVGLTAGCGGYCTTPGQPSMFALFEGGANGGVFAPSTLAGFGTNDSGGYGVYGVGGDNNAGNGGRGLWGVGGDALAGNDNGGEGVVGSGGDGFGNGSGARGLWGIGGNGNAAGSGAGGPGVLGEGGDSTGTANAGYGLQGFGGDATGSSGEGGHGVTGAGGDGAGALQGGRGADLSGGVGGGTDGGGGQGLRAFGGAGGGTNGAGGFGADVTGGAGQGSGAGGLGGKFVAGTSGATSSGARGVEAYGAAGGTTSGAGGDGLLATAGAGGPGGAGGRGAAFTGGAGNGSGNGGMGAEFWGGAGGATGNGGPGCIFHGAAGGATSGNGGLGVLGEGGSATTDGVGGYGGRFTGGNSAGTNKAGEYGVSGIGGAATGNQAGGYGGTFQAGTSGPTGAGGVGVRGLGGNAGASGGAGGDGVIGVGGDHGSGASHGGIGVRGYSTFGGYGGYFYGTASGGTGTRASLRIGTQSALPDGEVGAFAVVANKPRFYDGAWKNLLDYGDLDNIPSTFAPTQHALGGSDHSASTLAQLSALVSDSSLAGLNKSNTWTGTNLFNGTSATPIQVNHSYGGNSISVTNSGAGNGIYSSSFSAYGVYGRCEDTGVGVLGEVPSGASSPATIGVKGLNAFGGYGVVAEGKAAAPSRSALRIIAQDADPTVKELGALEVTSGSHTLGAGRLRFYDGTEMVSMAKSAYGGVSVKGNTTQTAIGTATTPVQFTGFTRNTPAHGATPDHTNDHVTCDQAGDYQVTMSGTVESVAGSSASVIRLEVRKNNGASVLGDLQITRDLSGGGGEKGVVSMSDIVTLAKNDTVEVWVANDTNTNNYLLPSFSLTIERVG